MADMRSWLLSTSDTLEARFNDRQLLTLDEMRDLFMAMRCVASPRPAQLPPAVVVLDDWRVTERQWRGGL